MNAEEAQKGILSSQCGFMTQGEEGWQTSSFVFGDLIHQLAIYPVYVWVLKKGNIGPDTLESTKYKWYDLYLSDEPFPRNFTDFTNQLVPDINIWDLTLK